MSVLRRFFFRTGPLRYFMMTAVAGWTSVVTLVFFIAWSNEHGQVNDQARLIARAVFLRDTRATMLLPRFIDTDSDSLLMDYALFTEASIESTFIGKHQAALVISNSESPFIQNATKPFEIRANIISLDPTRQTHRADSWETNAMNALGTTQSEYSSVVQIADGLYMRYAGALRDAPVCLQCHQRKDYRAGTLRGAMSIVVPIEEIWEAEANHRTITLLTLGSLWIVGLGGIVLMRRGMKQRIEERDQAFEENRRIESEKMKTESALAVSVEHLIRTEKRLQAELLRAEIAANLHDDIGATLSSTSIFSELLGKELADLSPRAAKLLARIKDNLHSVQLSLHDIVWSINPDNDELENILLKLQEDASDILDANGIGLHIDIAPIRGSITVPMEARKELLLIVKEAFNNIVRHAHAHEVTFTATIAEGFMRLTIGDDGCGFAADQRSDGNGLRNMKQRAEHVNGSMRIESELNKGTLLHFDMPIT